jgi:hypothetical protein
VICGGAPDPAHVAAVEPISPACLVSISANFFAAASASASGLVPAGAFSTSGFLASAAAACFGEGSAGASGSPFF